MFPEIASVGSRPRPGARLGMLAACFLAAAPASAQQILNLGPELLAQDEAFVITARAEAERLLFEVEIAEGYYLYRDRAQLRPLAGTPTLAALETPPGEIHTDEFFGEVETYRGLVQFAAPRPAGRADLLVELVIQGCADVGVCYPPYISSYTFTPDAKVGVLVANNLPEFASATFEPVANESALYTDLTTKSLLLVIALFFNAGILLSFTPCVLPMIPIAIGVVTDAGNRGRAHAFALALAYVLSMASCYALIGIATARAGGALAGTLQQPWLLYAFAVLFVLLGMATLLELNVRLLPGSVAARLQTLRNRQGTFSGALVSGLVAAVVVSPCVAAPLAGALLFIATTEDILVGGAALLALGLGMGVLPLLCALGARSLVPRAGPASVMLRQLFGLLLVGLGIWVLPAQVPAPLKMIALGALAALMLLLALRLVAQVSGARAKVAASAVAAVFFALAAVLVIGGVTGGTNLVAPLAHLGAAKKLEFETVTSIRQYSDRQVEAGVPSLEYYYADWCVSCRELEGYTFANADVVAELDDYRLVKVDVTRNSPELSQLMVMSEIVGPPAIVLRNQQGVEVAKLIGYVDHETLLDALTRVGRR